MKKGYRPNQVIVSEKVIKEEIATFVNPEEYDGASTTQEVLEMELNNVTDYTTKHNLYAKVKKLVEGGYFRVYNDDIMEFLETLNLNENTMKRAEENLLDEYVNVMYHAIKRHLGYKYNWHE